MINASYDLPPSLYLRQVLEHCPKAGKAYCILWDNRDKNNNVSLTLDDIRQTYLFSLKTWRDDLRLLAKEGLININEKKDGFSIEMVDFDFDEERVNMF